MKKGQSLERAVKRGNTYITTHPVYGNVQSSFATSPIKDHKISANAKYQSAFTEMNKGLPIEELMFEFRESKSKRIRRLLAKLIISQIRKESSTLNHFTRSGKSYNRLKELHGFAQEVLNIEHVNMYK